MTYSRAIKLQSYRDTFRKENNHMPTYNHVLAKKLSLSLLIKWNCPKGSYEQKLHSDVFVKQLFYYHPIFHSTLIFWSLQIKSSLAQGCLSTSVGFALQLWCWCHPLTHQLSSIYSCGWKPTPQTTPPVWYSIRSWYILMLFSGHLTSLCRRTGTDAKP